MEEHERREVKGFNATVIVEEYKGPPAPPLEASEAAQLNGGVHLHSAALPSVATLCNSAIGAGVLSLPFAFMKTGELFREQSRMQYPCSTCPCQPHASMQSLYCLCRRSPGRRPSVSEHRIC